jgi:hypothetical protein
VDDKVIHCIPFPGGPTYISDPFEQSPESTKKIIIALHHEKSPHD